MKILASPLITCMVSDNYGHGRRVYEDSLLRRDHRLLRSKIHQHIRYTVLVDAGQICNKTAEGQASNSTCSLEPSGALVTRTKWQGSWAVRTTICRRHTLSVSVS